MIEQIVLKRSYLAIISNLGNYVFSNPNYMYNFQGTIINGKNVNIADLSQNILIISQNTLPKETKLTGIFLL
jgi:hypothetical protein